jgi:small-conductance mechanosensitive channel
MLALETAVSNTPVISSTFTTFLYERLFPNLLVIFLYILIGSIALKIILKVVNKSGKLKLNPQSQMLISKTIRFIGIFVISVLVLNQLQVPLSALLGTAGIATVAIGIAAQNSMGNLISGIFLLTEHSFQIGDIIEVGNYIGTVTSVDLLSVKLNTFDGLHLRIPNETLIRSEITTITKNPIRRVPLKIGISYFDDIEKARDILFSVATKEPLALNDPAPFFMVSGYGSSSIDLFFGVWGKTSDFAALKSALLIEIKKAFDTNGIEIPFPHLTIRPAVELKREKEPKKMKHMDVTFEDDIV